MVWRVMLLATCSTALFCDVCRGGVDVLSVGLKDLVAPVLSEMAAGLCGLKYPVEACQTGGRGIVDIFLRSVTERYLNPEVACVQLHACDGPVYRVQNFTEWVEGLYDNREGTYQPAASSGQRLLVGQVTDPHIDLAYAPGSSSHCDESICCQTRFGNSTPQAGFWGDFDCDLPLWTFESALQSLSTQPLDFLIYTGDSASHSVLNQTEEAKVYISSRVAQLLTQYFPMPIYPILGNNDGNPAEEFDFEDSLWLTKPMAELYSASLGPEAMQSFKLTGSYSLLHLNTSLRIVAINTQACKNLNFYLIANITDPGAQIAFLQSQLALAESQGERVFILGHIPPGSEDCMSDWADRYNAVVGRYKEVVAGQFFGHTHSDQIYVSKDYLSGEPASVQWVAPSVTTLSNRNPSYRVYFVDSGDFSVLDYAQYRLDLALANALNTTVWDYVYSFQTLYSLPNLNVTSIWSLAERLLSNSTLASIYLDNYNTSGPDFDLRSSSYLQSLFCSITSPVYRDYLQCTNSTLSRLNLLLETLQGPWTYLEIS